MVEAVHHWLAKSNVLQCNQATIANLNVQGNVTVGPAIGANAVSYKLRLPSKELASTANEIRHVECHSCGTVVIIIVVVIVIVVVVFIVVVSLLGPAG